MDNLLDLSWIDRWIQEQMVVKPTPGINPAARTPAAPAAAKPAQNRPVIGTVWGYPGDGDDEWAGGITAWAQKLFGEDRNLLGVSLPTSGKNAIPLSQVPLGGLVTVSSSQTGKSLTVPRIDVGPAGWTGAGVDLTWNMARALGLNPKEGKFAGLTVTPTGQKITKAELSNYNYTGYGWIAPGVKNAMKEAPTSPIEWTGAGAGGAAGAAAGAGIPSVGADPAALKKGLVTVGFGIVILVLVVSLLQDKTPVEVVVDTAKGAGNKVKEGAKAAALAAA